MWEIDETGIYDGELVKAQLAREAWKKVIRAKEFSSCRCVRWGGTWHLETEED